MPRTSSGSRRLGGGPAGSATNQANGLKSSGAAGAPEYVEPTGAAQNRRGGSSGKYTATAHRRMSDDVIGNETRRSRSLPTHARISSEMYVLDAMSVSGIRRGPQRQRRAARCSTRGPAWLRRGRSTQLFEPLARRKTLLQWRRAHRGGRSVLGGPTVPARRVVAHQQVSSRHSAALHRRRHRKPV